MNKIVCVSMVKNEEKVLERMIQSVIGAVDEFFIVDTGSTDSTIEIIKKYQNDVKQIEFVNYVDTKNQVLDLVEKESECEYILFMDADEYIIQGGEKIRDLVNKNYDYIQCNIIEGDDNLKYPRVRIWKNKKGSRFQGPGVHEYIDIKDGNNFVYDNDILVRHCHLHRTGTDTKKFMNYINILEKFKNSNPNDPRCLFYLGQTYQILGLKQHAINNYINYLRYSNFIGEKYIAYLELSSLSDTQKDKLKYLDNAKKLMPNKAESYYRKGIIFYNIQNYEVALNYFNKCIELRQYGDKFTEYDCFVYIKEYYELPLEFMMLSYYQLGEYKKSMKCCIDLIKFKSDNNILDTRNINNLLNIFPNL